VLRDFEPDERDFRYCLLAQALGSLADEAALLAEGTGKADERYMSRVAHPRRAKTTCQESKA